jgi:hypothetical protein
MSKTSDPSAETPATGTDGVAGVGDDPEEESHLERWSCYCCGEPDHSIFDCPVAEERREERREPEAALRLDPVARTPHE